MWTRSISTASSGMWKPTRYGCRSTERTCSSWRGCPRTEDTLPLSRSTPPTQTTFSPFVAPPSRFDSPFHTPNSCALSGHHSITRPFTHYIPIHLLRLSQGEMNNFRLGVRFEIPSTLVIYHAPHPVLSCPPPDSYGGGCHRRVSFKGTFICFIKLLTFSHIKYAALTMSNRHVALFYWHN